MNQVSARCRRSGAALLAVLTLAGCGGLSERDRDLLDAGERALASGDWDRADASFSQILAESPSHGPTLVLRARARLELGRADAALEDVDAAIDQSLGDDDRLRAFVLKARALIASGRRTVSDVEFRNRSAGSDAARRARELFLAANSALHWALDIAPNDYEANLWRAYCLYRQENPRKALTFIEKCLSLQSDDWRASFFHALILEGLHGPNAASFEEVLSVVEQSPTPDRLTAFLYLVAVAQDLPVELRTRLADATRRLLASGAPIDQALVEFVADADRRLADAKRSKRIASTVDEAKALAAKDLVHDALELLESRRAEIGDAEELDDLSSALADRWTRLLDLKAEAYLRIGDSTKLTDLLDEYRLARQSSRKLELKITLQQKINDLQTAIAHLTSSSKMREIGELLKSGAHHDVLRALATVKPETLDDDDRDLYHYATGSALYRLGEWETAAMAFARVTEGAFDDVSLLKGLALIKSGKHEDGISLLAGVQPLPNEDDANRVLATHHAASGDTDRALAHLQAIVKKLSTDHELEMRSLRKRGAMRLEAGDTEAAIKDLELARSTLDSHLRRRDPELYALLGDCYFRLGDKANAKRTYRDLIDSSKTEARSRFKESLCRLGEICLGENAEADAYVHLREFRDLGGEIPSALRDEYGRLVATFADFMPLDRVVYWNYTSTRQDYNYTLTIKERDGARYRVERREVGKTDVELWERDGNFLTRQTGEGGAVTFRIPVNLHPVERALPAESYDTGGDGSLHYTTEIVAIDQTIELSTKRYDHCLKVRVTRTVHLGADETRRTRYVIWLAPDVGEVRREVYQDEVLVAETVLAGLVHRDE